MRRANVTGFLAMALTVGALGACGKGGSLVVEQGDEAAKPANEAPANAPAATEVGAGSTSLERAQKALERGGDLNAAKQQFEAALADPSLSADEKDEARLGLSQAKAALGDTDGAVALVEQLLQTHGDSSRFAVRESAEKQLRKLLTGHEEDTSNFSISEHYAPVARALAPYFKPDEKGETLIDVYSFGDRGSRDDLGIFNIAAAKRDMALEECAFCDQHNNFSRSMSSSGSWVSLPRAMGEAASDMPQADRSMLVFYMDLEANRVPSRYDAYLAIPSNEIVSHLERGEGLIAMRERPGAKPTIVIAAPRFGQLSAVTEAFSKLTSLPKTPLVVPVAAGLTPDEIKSTIRGAKSAEKRCYDTLLAKDPSASGQIVVSFSIDVEGNVRDARADDAKSTLKDGEMQNCVADAISHLTFAKTGERINVSFPLMFKAK